MESSYVEHRTKLRISPRESLLSPTKASMFSESPRYSTSTIKKRMAMVAEATQTDEEQRMEHSEELSKGYDSISGEPRRRMPLLFGIKTFACVILLALGSGSSLHRSLLSLNEEQRSSVQAVEHNATESKRLPAEGTKAAHITEADEHVLVVEKKMTQDNNTAFLTKETSSFLRVANYQFPSVQLRLQYYMGDWYNSSDWTVPDSDCKLLRNVTDYLRVYDVDIMMHTTDIKECIDRHALKSIMKYCRNTHDIINSTIDEADRNNNHWLFNFGDRTYGIKETLPIITKARRSALSLFAPQPIVWLLNKGRHYKDLENYHKKIVKQGKEVPWSKKLPKIFWRGSTTYNKDTDTSRLDKLAQWINYDDNYTDIAFSEVVQMSTDFRREYVKSQYFREKNSLVEMNRYKYLLSVEGNDVATGLKWMLYSNSVVFMSRPTVATWAMEDLLVPYVHYIPLSNDYSNLLEMVKWANEHDEACQEISQRATEFIEHLWMSKQAKKDTKYLQKALVTSYVAHFDVALSRCAPETKELVISNSSHIHRDKSESSIMANDTLSQSKRSRA